jgi:response regulator RpfG family c-di-GMP phosphodiesterase/serine/threonine protein kinase
MAEQGLSWPNGHTTCIDEPDTDRPKSGEIVGGLIASSLIAVEDWDNFPASVREQVNQSAGQHEVLAKLVEHGLLTEYQAARIESGRKFGLLLGNYRVLDRIGAGGMGVVFKAEHRLLRRPVALKVLAQSSAEDSRMLSRFFAEMRAVARLRHPNIVAAMDAGEVVEPGPAGQVLHYLVMEYVPGKDLEVYVKDHGLLPATKACDVIYQLAGALAEADKHHLVHRDLKPSNIMVTPEDQAKLLDFGLVHHFCNRLTNPSTVLGTIDYMAPEQASDAASVDIRADIFGLGGILFWCLTGRSPFPPKGSLTQELLARVTQAPPTVRELRPDVPPELDAMLLRMMALRPEDRYQTPEAVMRAILPFLRPQMREHCLTSALNQSLNVTPDPSLDGTAGARVHRILIVDDEAGIRDFCRCALQTDGVHCETAADGVEALHVLSQRAFDLVLLDVDMPKMTGHEVCRKLRENPPGPNIKVVLFSGRASADEVARLPLAGADDYLSKPFSLTQLQARVKAALRLKEAQDRSDLLNRHLLAVNQQLEANLTAQSSDLVRARNALVLALAKCVEYRDGETGAHLQRLQRYSRRLAEEAAATPMFAEQIDPFFIEMLECCAPLHDLGKVGLPDHILLKPGKLTPDERVLMQAHTVIGASTLEEVARQHGFALAFLQMAVDITRHHHERYDGTGYPDRLAGSAIPLAARIVAIADVYDALRCRRIYKPALSHSAALQMMVENSSGHFDPALVAIFQRFAPDFEKIFQELRD